MTTCLLETKTQIVEKREEDEEVLSCRRRVQAVKAEKITCQGKNCLTSIVPMAPPVAVPSSPPKATAGARQAKNRKKVDDSTWLKNDGRSNWGGRRAVVAILVVVAFGVAVVVVGALVACRDTFKSKPYFLLRKTPGISRFSTIIIQPEKYIPFIFYFVHY